MSACCGLDTSQYLVANIRLEGEPPSVEAALAALKERLKARPGTTWKMIPEC